MNDIMVNYINRQLNEVPLTLNRKLSSFQGETFNKRDDIHILKRRIDDYIKKESDERFFVLPGLRGVGKTTLLLQCYEYLLKEKNIPQSNLLYISCDDLNATGESNLKDAIEIYLKNVFNTTVSLLNEEVFIFIDEAHYDKNWSLHAKILFDKSQNIFMMITGSSSLHLNYNADAARRLKIHEILPLNYSQHLKLKYNYTPNISEKLIRLLFEGDVETAQRQESKVKRELINLKDYDENDWDTYFKYGGFCSLLNKKYNEDITLELWTIISKIISNDLTPEFNLTKEAQDTVYRILVLLASQKPGEISQNKIAGNLSKSTSTINTIFRILEQTKLIFHYQAYGGAESQSRKSWKYYIATPSLKNGINRKFGHTITNQRDYEGILLENMIASTLNNLQNTFNYNIWNHFDVFYDNSTGGVDFIIQKEFQKPIPIEVGLGKKKDKQIKKFIDKKDSPYGILISNKSNKIEKNNDIIYIPPKTFSFI